MCAGKSILTGFASQKSFQNRFQVTACLRAVERMLFYWFWRLPEGGVGPVFDPPVGGHGRKICSFGALEGLLLVRGLFGCAESTSGCVLTCISESRGLYFGEFHRFP